MDCGAWSWCCHQVVLWSHRQVCEYECISTKKEKRKKEKRTLVPTSSALVPNSPPTSLTLVSTSFALAPDSQLTVAIDRGQATTVLSEHHNKEQRKRTQRRSATMFAVYLLCVLSDYLCLTPAMGCAHMDDHRACRVTSVHTLSTTTKED